MSNEFSPVSITPSQLVQLRRDARRIALSRKKVRARQAGNYMSRLRGRGMEFDEVRAYQAGDDIRNIDWRVTARTTQAHTKLYREERERPVMLCLDYRSNMHFATRGMFKSVMASQLSGLIAWAANLNGDRIGGILFSDKQHVSIKAGRGKHAVLELFHRMSELHQQAHQEHFLNTATQDAVNSSQADTVADTLGRLRRITRPGSLVFIVSDFLYMDDEAQKQLIELSRHNEVFLISVHDPIEASLPEKGLLRFKDRRRDFMINSARKNSRQQHAERFQNQQQHLKDLARKYRMGFISCSTAEDPVEQLRTQLEVAGI